MRVSFSGDELLKQAVVPGPAVSPLHTPAPTGDSLQAGNVLWRHPWFPPSVIAALVRDPGSEGAAIFEMSGWDTRVSFSGDELLKPSEVLFPWRIVIFVPEPARKCTEARRSLGRHSRKLTPIALALLANPQAQLLTVLNV